jgi:predicted O-methyltransferase YrrM
VGVKAIHHLREFVLEFLADRVSARAAVELFENFAARGKLSGESAERLVRSAVVGESLSPGGIRRMTDDLVRDDRSRHIFLDQLNKTIKAGYPGVDHTPFDLPIDGDIGFENLAGLFASTPLDEFIITMNIRQAAYLFGLIRRMGAGKVIQIGGDWGGSTLLIAAAMQGGGRFWSIDDPARLRYDIEVLGRELKRPVADQVADMCARLGLQAELFEGDSSTIELETGEVDLVFIDGDHAYENARSDFERWGMRVRVGGALLLDDAVVDPFLEPQHTADVKRLAAEIGARPDFRLVKQVRRLVHFERLS